MQPIVFLPQALQAFPPEHFLWPTPLPAVAVGAG